MFGVSANPGQSFIPSDMLSAFKNMECTVGGGTAEQCADAVDRRACGDLLTPENTAPRHQAAVPGPHG